MPAVLRTLAIALPLAEILVLALVIDQVGFGWTALALAGSAVLGILVIRVLGAASLGALRDALARREPPAGALVRGACVLLAGMLLILPGFLSDLVALLLLIPPVRGLLLRGLWRPRGPAAMARDGTRDASGNVVIDGDYQEVRPETPPDRQLGNPPDRQP